MLPPITYAPGVLIVSNPTADFWVRPLNVESWRIWRATFSSIGNIATVRPTKPAARIASRYVNRVCRRLDWAVSRGMMVRLSPGGRSCADALAGGITPRVSTSAAIAAAPEARRGLDRTIWSRADPGVQVMRRRNAGIGHEPGIAADRPEPGGRDQAAA